MKALLPIFFHYFTGNDLIRIGRNHDGGYLLSKLDIEKSNSLISLGISDDWSFEEDFIKHNKVPLFAYDNSISKEIFFKNIIKSILRIYKIKNILNWPKEVFKSIKVFFSYLNFFSEDRKHFQKLVGLDTGGVNCSMNEIFKSVTSNNIFLKIDIEGSEYRALESITENEDRIEGMVIEFHNCDINLNIIKNFIEKINLKLIHIHANNFGEIRSKDKLPITLELTFSKNSKLTDQTLLPHPLDMPNNKLASEISLSIEY